MDSTLDSYIKVIKNVVPKKLAKKIIGHFADSKHWVEAQTTSGSTTYRNCSTIYMSDPNIVNEDPIAAELDAEIFSVIKSILSAYGSEIKWTDTDGFEDTGYSLLKYTKNQNYKEHHDDYGREGRKLTVSINLNDGYKGGKMKFFNGKRSYKYGTGDALVFPASFLFPHQITPIKNGVRYSIVTWIV